MTFEVTILGSNSALPAHGRHPTSQVLNHNEKFFLLDCGEGTQMQLSNYKIKRSKIDHIFISHLHGDHYYGLIGLLTSYHLLKRVEPLHIYAPRGLKEIIDVNFNYSNTRLVYELIVHENDDASDRPIYENEHLEVTTILMNHRIPCWGFLFREKKHDRKISGEKLAELNVPVSLISQIKKGMDIEVEGKTIPNHQLTSDPAPERTYAFCSDTLHYDQIIDKVFGVDLLYHEATFMDESSERAKLTFHSTTLQAADIANRAKVKKLLIGHFSAKYENLQLILDEARTAFENTELAIEGKRYAL